MDGPLYDELVRELIEAIPHENRRVAGIRAVKAIRQLLWDEMATTESDESIWLSPAGWERAELQYGVTSPAGPAGAGSS